MRYNFFLDNFFAVIRGVRRKEFIFIKAIISKWYILILIPTLLATYYVFEGLEKAGIFDLVTEFTIEKFNLVTRITKNCTAKILDIKQLMRCVEYTN